MKLEDLEVYQLSMNIREKIWGQVKNWQYFEKDTIGKQIVRAVDSVAANISEGFGRYHYKDRLNFSYYARGSLYETKTFLTKANQRNLITDDESHKLLDEINNLGVKLNNYINATRNTILSSKKQQSNYTK